LERATRIEDVIEQEHVPTMDIGQGVIEKCHHARALGAAVVTGDFQAFDVERSWQSAQQVGGKNQGSFEQNQRDDRASGKLAIDLFCHRIETFFDHFFIDQNALNVFGSAQFLRIHRSNR